MLEVHTVWAQVRRPRDDTDLGQVTDGYYTVADDVLTMTDKKGVPVRDLTSGEKFTRKLKPGEDAGQVASRLTMEVYQMLRGENGPGAVKGFGRQLDYPKSGIA
jgi:hypothetical protein